MKKPVPLPTKEQLLDFIRESPGQVGKREIARAFRLGADQKQWLRLMIKELETSGAIQRGVSKRYAGPAALPDATVIVMTGTDSDGELLAKPLVWREEGPPPRIFVAPVKAGEPPLGVGDRALAKMRRLKENMYEARVIRKVSSGPARILGVFQRASDGSGRLHPTDRRQKAEYEVADADRMEAEPGELVLTELLPSTRGGRHAYGLKPVKVIERLGNMANPKAISLVAIHTHDIPDIFPDAAVEQAEAAGPAPLDKRTDLRQIPLITIDGEDARDFDDAVWAEADGSGWRVIVAIADVAWYVRPGDELDKEAFKRGNSVYFPDRVVPMLPEALSNGWCSLKPDEERPCMAVEMRFDAEGNKTGHKFVRGLMKSAARTTYTQVQKAMDGEPDELTGPLVDPVLKPLYGAWGALQKARSRRGVLELDIPERKVIIGADGQVERVAQRERYDSHKLIEDFMIAANVAAAEEIERVKRPCMYRVHDVPTQEKLDNLREFLSTVGIPFAKGQVIKASIFNGVLEKAKTMTEAPLINEVVLRSQAQAVYSPDNLGHFGLGLARYAHFTSPIRRYADLLVHRALIDGLKLGEGQLPADGWERFAEIGEHISATERRAAAAERDCVNRFTAAFLADRVGARFDGKVSGVTRFGLFVTLTESGGDGLVPVSSLPNDYYDHDEVRHRLVGKRHGMAFALGDSVEVELAEANPLTGGLVFRLMVDGQASKGRPFTRGGPVRPFKPGTSPGRKKPSFPKGKKVKRR
jgi:ribonuclease R